MIERGWEPQVCECMSVPGLLQGREDKEGMVRPGYLSPRQGSRKGPTSPHRHPVPLHFKRRPHQQRDAEQEERDRGPCECQGCDTPDIATALVVGVKNLDLRGEV